MSDFSYETELTARFRDLDALGHVNNAVYATYLEHARTQYIEDVFGASAADANVVLVSLEIDYNRPITFQEDVTVALRVTEMGETSIPMEYEVRADGEVAATANTVIVTLDEDGAPRPIPEDIRERITEYEQAS